MRFLVLNLCTIVMPYCAQALAEPCRLTELGGAQAASPVSVSFHIEGNDLIADFDVERKQIYGKPVLAPDEHPYMFDVVEFFVSLSPSRLPYFEVELSPYNQNYNVKIRDLHHPFQEGVDLHVESSVTATESGWTAHLRLPLAQLGDPHSEIFGNAYAVLGQKPNRKYFSAFPLPLTQKPNFHQPKAFQPLLKCQLPPPEPGVENETP